MRIATALTIGAALAASGCGDNPLQDLNPFASPQVANLDGPAAPPGGAIRAQDDSPLVAQVTALEVRPLPGGAVVEARGLPPVQGHWDAALRPVGRGPQDGVLVYGLRVEPPPVAERVGPPSSREVVTAAYVSDAVLRGVSRIRVVGLTNAREARR